MQISEDTVMLSALKQDNKLEAYQYFFMKYYKPLCLKACQMLGNPEKAKETVQQLFIEVWKKKAYLNITHSAGGYFYQLLYERCLQQRGDTIKEKAICPPCKTGPAVVPMALYPTLAIAMDR